MKQTTDHDDWLERGDSEPVKRFERDLEEVLSEREERRKELWEKSSDQ